MARRMKLRRMEEPLQMIRKRELAKRLGVNPWTIDRWRKLGLIPEPIRLSDQVLVWRVAGGCHIN